MVGKDGSVEKQRLFYRLLGWEIVRKACYYNKNLAEMPVVCENRISIKEVIDKAIINAVLGFVEVRNERM